MLGIELLVMGILAYYSIKKLTKGAKADPNFINDDEVREQKVTAAQKYREDVRDAVTRAQAERHDPVGDAIDELEREMNRPR